MVQLVMMFDGESYTELIDYWFAWGIGAGDILVVFFGLHISV